MVKCNAFLVVDMGNSSTRVKVICGKDTKGIPFSRTFTLNNTFAPVYSEDYSVSSDYTQQDSCILKMDYVRPDNIKIRGFFANGLLQKTEFYNAEMRPSSTLKKYKNDTTFITARLVFLYAMLALVDMKQVASMDDLDVTWKVLVLLPPGDVAEGTKPMTQAFLDITSVEYLFPQITIPVKISNVYVQPEGFCAYIACLYDVGCKLRITEQDLPHKVILIYDIGAGTTEFLIIDNNKLVKNSLFTVQAGGNNVKSKVRKKLNDRNYRFSNKDLDKALVTGIITSGNGQYSIVDIINEATEEVAQRLASEYIDFIEASDFSTSSINCILGCGGGSIDTFADTGLVPLTKKLNEQFKIMTPTAETVKLPTVTVTKTREDGTPYNVVEEISPRDMNIFGAGIIAEKYIAADSKK